MTHPSLDDVRTILEEEFLTKDEMFNDSHIRPRIANTITRITKLQSSQGKGVSLKPGLKEALAYCIYKFCGDSIVIQGGKIVSVEDLAQAIHDLLEKRGKE